MVFIGRAYDGCVIDWWDPYAELPVKHTNTNMKKKVRKKDKKRSVRKEMLYVKTYSNKNVKNFKSWGKCV